MIGAYSFLALLLLEASESLLSLLILIAPALAELWFLFSFLDWALEDLNGDLFETVESKVFLYTFWAAGTLESFLLALFLRDF